MKKTMKKSPPSGIEIIVVHVSNAVLKSRLKATLTRRLREIAKATPSIFQARKISSLKVPTARSELRPSPFLP